MLRRGPEDPLNAYVIGFERLRKSDRRNGRRQELIPRRDDQLAGGCRSAGARWLRHNIAGVSRLPETERRSTSASVAALANLDVEDVEKLAATGAQIREWVLSTPFLPSLKMQ